MQIDHPSGIVPETTADTVIDKVTGSEGTGKNIDSSRCPVIVYACDRRRGVIEPKSRAIIDIQSVEILRLIAILMPGPIEFDRACPFAEHRRSVVVIPVPRDLHQGRSDKRSGNQRE